METTIMQLLVEWSTVLEDCGGLCVRKNGIFLMPLLYADNLD